MLGCAVLCTSLGKLRKTFLAKSKHLAEPNWNVLCFSSSNFNLEGPWSCSYGSRDNTIGQSEQRGVSHTVALPFTLKSILRQKKNYGNSNISPCKNNIIFPKKKSSKRNQNPSRYYYNSIITNLKFQHKPKYHLSNLILI